MQQITYSDQVDDTYFVASLDNDRSQIHPEHISRLDPGKVSRLPKKEQNKPCRYCELEQTINAELGAERPIPGAIAVPVEMLESWLLLISNPTEYRDEASLPLFARKTAPLAKKYFASHSPPPQLKELKKLEKERLALASNSDYCLYCAEALEPEELAERSPIFALFKEQVERWLEGESPEEEKTREDATDDYHH